MKGEARDTWLKLVRDQSILVTDNYAVDNTYAVENFETRQKGLTIDLLDEGAIEDLKMFLQNTKKSRKMWVDIDIRS